MITLNGVQYDVQNIVRRGDRVTATVGCEQITIDMSTLAQLSTSKSEAGWYIVSRDPETRQLDYIDENPGVRCELIENKLCVVDANGKRLCGIAKSTGYQYENGKIWNAEFFPTRPIKGSV